MSHIRNYDTGLNCRAGVRGKHISPWVLVRFCSSIASIIAVHHSSTPLSVRCPSGACAANVARCHMQGTAAPVSYIALPFFRFLVYSPFFLSSYCSNSRNSDPGSHSRLFSPLPTTVHVLSLAFLSREDFSPFFPHGLATVQAVQEHSVVRVAAAPSCLHVLSGSMSAVSSLNTEDFESRFVCPSARSYQTKTGTKWYVTVYCINCSFSAPSQCPIRSSDIFRLWGQVDHCPSWDGAWLTLVCRATQHPPSTFDWTPYMADIYNLARATIRTPVSMGDAGAAPLPRSRQVAYQYHSIAPPACRTGGMVALNKLAVMVVFFLGKGGPAELVRICLLYTSPSPRDKRQSRMPSSA